MNLRNSVGQSKIFSSRKQLFLICLLTAAISQIAFLFGTNRQCLHVSRLKCFPQFYAPFKPNCPSQKWSWQILCSSRTSASASKFQTPQWVHQKCFSAPGSFVPICFSVSPHIQTYRHTALYYVLSYNITLKC